MNYLTLLNPQVRLFASAWMMLGMFVGVVVGIVVGLLIAGIPMVCS